MPNAHQNEVETFAKLRHAKDESLKDLLGRKPGQKHYRRALKAYLEADYALQRAIMDRLGIDTREEAKAEPG
jgi:hypothetical protein